MPWRYVTRRSLTRRPLTRSLTRPWLRAAPQTALLGAYVAHLLACGFYLVGANAYYHYDVNSSNAHPDGYGRSWLQGKAWMTDDQDMEWAQLGPPYVASIYWAFTTISTVGYGDITPDSTSERAYVLMALIFGTSVFGYIVGQVRRTRAPCCCHHLPLFGALGPAARRAASVVTRSAFLSCARTQMAQHFDCSARVQRMAQPALPGADPAPPAPLGYPPSSPLACRRDAGVGGDGKGRYDPGAADAKVRATLFVSGGEEVAPPA